MVTPTNEFKISYNVLPDMHSIQEFAILPGLVAVIRNSHVVFTDPTPVTGLS